MPRRRLPIRRLPWGKIWSDIENRRREGMTNGEWFERHIKPYLKLEIMDEVERHRNIRWRMGRRKK